MANKDSPMELYEISMKFERSNSDSDWEDSGEDPDYNTLEETWCIQLYRGEEVLMVTASVNDGENFGKGLLEKLKMEECKLYLRKNGLRLTGNKDTLIERIREHLE
ncbi:hypothetical protein V8G54_022701 [Vigna mungo]|uniref:SAP domain-containing protein n=1 Tax=Vigna mungo TaxID=3915 RepID=A0AAQ3N3J8_VIGMU